MVFAPLNSVETEVTNVYSDLNSARVMPLAAASYSAYSSESSPSVPFVVAVAFVPSGTGVVSSNGAGSVLVEFVAGYSATAGGALSYTTN